MYLLLFKVFIILRVCLKIINVDRLILILLKCFSFLESIDSTKILEFKNILKYLKNSIIKIWIILYKINKMWLIMFYKPPCICIYESGVL